jgi:hypothetical protein
MLRLLASAVTGMLVLGAVRAGELDKEFAGKKAISANAANDLNAPTADKVKASELDDESPDQAYRGWRGGWGRGYRGYGWSGGYRGYGWGAGYRGYGWGGYNRPYGYGWNRAYWGVPYVNLSFGYPAYYAPYYSYSPYSYSYYY